MTKARILFLDIEASNLAASIGFLLSVGYKWGHEKKPHVLRVDSTKEWKKDHTDDRGLLKAFEPVWNEADLVVHHFGDFYDVPFLQTRRIINNMTKMPDVRSVDTWRIARKLMKFHNNRLVTLEGALGCPYAKTKVDFKHWTKAMVGVKASMDYIVEHNKLDVLVLEWVYNKIAPMLASHPTTQLNPYNCRVCGSNRMKGHGWRPAQKYWYQRLICQDCGHTRQGQRREDK